MKKSIILGLIILCGELSAQVKIDSGLVAYYPFNGNALDKGPSGIDGTVYGAILTTDNVYNDSSAYLFDGVNDYISLGNYFNDINIPLSISVWILKNEIGIEGIFASDEPNDGSHNYYGFRLEEANLKIGMAILSGGPNWSVYRRSGSTPHGVLKLNEWHHIVAVVRGLTNMSIYIDGEDRLSSYSGTGGAMKHNNYPATIGRNNASDQGNSNFDGKIDNLRIYNRALSKNEVLAIYKEESHLIIDTSELMVEKIGNYFSRRLVAKYGTQPYTWTIESGELPENIALSTDGVLEGRSNVGGDFDFFIKVTDSTGDQIIKKCTLKVLLTLPPSDFRITKSSTVPVPGRKFEYYIFVENIGNVSDSNINVIDFLDPRFTLLSVDPPTEADLTTMNDSSFVLWNIPYLQAGESALLTHQVKLDPSTKIGSKVGANPAMVDTDMECLAECLSKLSSATARCSLCPFICTACVKACLANPITCAGCVAACFWCWWDCGDRLDDVESCLDKCSADNDDDEKEAEGPYDPNEMVVMAEKYIQSDEKLVYAIHYENIGTVEARDVFLTDTLGLDFDISTLEIITQEGSSFDPSLRVLKWELLGKNLLPGETDHVLFSIKPVNGLASGTEIHNKAVIQFEIFESMSTNEVINIIDNVPPEATMDPLTSEIDTLDFEISWSGVDSIGEIEFYTVFVSTDSSAFCQFIKKTNQTSAIFHGEPGRTYEFLCTAEDVAGNKEIQEPIAETKIHISSVATTISDNNGSPFIFDLSQNYPNPFNISTTISFQIAKPTNVELKIYNLLGKEVKTLVNKKMLQGKQIITWNGMDNNNIGVSSGLYFVKIKAGDFVDVKKVVLIK